MLNKTRRKFIIWAMVAMVVLTAVLIAAVNLVNWAQTDQRLRTALWDIAQAQSLFRFDESDEAFPAPETESDRGTDNSRIGASSEEAAEGEEAAVSADKENGAERYDKEHTVGELPSGAAALQDSSEMIPSNDKKDGSPGKHGDKRQSALIQYGSRFFYVSADENGQIIKIFQEDMIAEDTAQLLVDAIWSGGASTGSIQDYRYLVVGTEQDCTLICFLDCTIDMEALRSLLVISLIVGGAGIVLAFFFILRMSRIAVEPVRVSIEKQKQFITNAGHELKTPLTAISANMDILTMDLGENEWVTGTRRQVRRMRQLVENMTTLSKIEEDDSNFVMQFFSLSELAKECCDTFSAVAQIKNRDLEDSIEDGLQIQGDKALVEQLLSILCDNAIKYSTEDEPIRVKLYRDGRHAFFETMNSWEQDVEDQHLNNLFERFYRGDPARSSEGKSSGHGLGLSIAQAIAGKNHAELTVFQDAEHRIVFRVRFRIV